MTHADMEMWFVAYHRNKKVRRNLIFSMTALFSIFNISNQQVVWFPEPLTLKESKQREANSDGDEDNSAAISRCRPTASSVIVLSGRPLAAQVTCCVFNGSCR